MIDNEKTFKLFGYYPEDLSKYSRKKVVHICNICGRERIITKATVSYKPIGCKSCSRKGEKNGVFGKHLTAGKNNGNFKDGHNCQQNYCIFPGCLNKINNRTIEHGGHCYFHAHDGELNGNYKDGRTPLRTSIRNLAQSVEWKNQVFERDNFTCQECGKKDCKLEAHHLKHFSVILNKFLCKYDQFSPIEDKETLLRLATKYKPFWDLSNGQTLCEDCHSLEHQNKEVEI